MPATQGLFITFEGCEGAGKSLQCKKLRAFLLKRGVDAVLTREPGGTTVGEQIRGVILDTNNTRMSPVAEVLLYAAARAQHVNEVIKPALEDGRIVICDRFIDSSVAYQGDARGLLPETIAEVNRFATGGLQPDVTFFIDIEPEDSFARKNARSGRDRIEMEAMAFHRRVYEGYKRIAAADANRVVTIDGYRGSGAVHADIVNKINHILLERGF